MFGRSPVWRMMFVAGAAFVICCGAGCASGGWYSYRHGSRGGPAGRAAAGAAVVGAALDELWVIVRPKALPERQAARPGCGALIARVGEEGRRVPVPLKHTDVKAAIAGNIATVEVTQQFHNPFDTRIQARYIFPLPQNAAVHDFVMTIGERRIRGIIRERKEAERIYHQALAAGLVASLLTQERPNVFRQLVGNIEPGRQIDVNIKYFHTLTYVDGWFEFVFPMVVGPRFNPPGSTDGVGAVARGSRGASGQATEVQYLRPGERSGHDIALSVSIDAGTPIEQVACRSHVIEQRAAAPNRAKVTLSPRDAIPNKDFVLRYRPAGASVKSALLAHRDKRGGFFTLSLYPPADSGRVERHPMELVFVVDCSGSMDGAPIAQAKRAVMRGLRRLQPVDTFQIIRFSNNASQLGPAPLPATDDNVRRGMQYATSLRSDGGTMMIEGIKAALDFPHDPARLRFVTFLTDGYIGNEKEILREMTKRLGPTRVFSFGVGPAVNRYLLERMAVLGKGVVAYVGIDDGAAEVMDSFFARVTRAVMTDIRIDWGDVRVAEIYPRRVPDLFAGRPVVLTGRFEGPGPTEIRIHGQLAGRASELLVPADPDRAAPPHPGIPLIWARSKIADLTNLGAYESDPGIPGRIKDVALEYGLVSAYTAFVAVDSLTRTKGDFGTTVAVPVPVPEGVRYDTTVQE